MKKKIAIYIAGYGRSGSTILDYYLSKAISALSLGEISMVNKDFYIDCKSKCLCGKKLNLCKLHKNLIKKKKIDNLILWYKKILPQTSLLIRYFFYFYLKKIKKIKKIKLNDLSLIKNELEIIDKVIPNTILVDSSKSTLLTSNRPYVLKKLGYEVIIVNLYRPFFETFKSVLKGSNAFLSGKIKKEKSFRIIRFFIGFFFATLKARSLSKNFFYISVKHHDLLFRKNLVINKIKKYILSVIANKKIKFKKTKEIHLVGGNRLKKNINF